MLNGQIAQSTLFNDLGQYTENDPSFKIELIELMIDNLRELQQAHTHSIVKNDPVDFLKACHKVKTTLSMLGNEELEGAVLELKKPGSSAATVSLFNRLIEAIVSGLLAERQR